MKYLALVVAALRRRPVRTWLTLASLVVAFLLFGLLRAVATGFSSDLGTDAHRLVVAPRYAIIDLLPVSHWQRILNVPGVEAASHRTWFGGIYQDQSQFFPKWPVPPEDFLALFSEYELPADQAQAFIATRTGAIVGRQLAERFGWELGARIPVEADIWPRVGGSRVWEFDLVGIYQVPREPNLEQQMFMHYDYFDEGRAFAKGNVGRFGVRISDPEGAGEVAAAIDALFANSAYETRTGTEKEYAQMFANQFGNISLILTGILGAVFFTILLVTGNTMSRAVRERISELAILKTMGFSGPLVLALVLAESLGLALVGAVLGLAIAGWLAPGLNENMGAFLAVIFDVEVALTGLAAALALGLVVGLPPGIRAMRLSIVDALRGE